MLELIIHDKKKLRYNTPNAHVSLFVYSLVKPLIKTNNPDDWDITAVKKDKALSMCTKYNIGKRRSQSYTFRHYQLDHIQTAANHLKIYTPK